MALSNTITNLIPEIMARGMMALRERVLMTRLVNLDYSEEAREKGDTIDIPLPSAIAASAVTPAAVPSAPSDSAPTKVSISLSNWWKTNFGLTDKEMGQIATQKNFMPLQMGEAFRGLANKINATVFALYPGVYSCVGTAGTTPFGSGITVTTATNARKMLNKQICPLDNRRAVLDFDAEAAALALSEFSDADKVGSGNVKISGEIGRKFGIDWYADNATPTHTSGTIGGDGTTATKIKAATTHAVGVSSLSVTVGATNGAALKKGDIFTIAGDTQQYAVTADVSGAAEANITVAITPALKVGVTGGEVMTAVSGCGQASATDHVVNLAFHRDAFALAMRAPGDGVNEMYQNPNQYVAGDPASGLVFRLELIRNYKMVTWELDALWGVQLVRPEFATRILG